MIPITNSARNMMKAMNIVLWEDAETFTKPGKLSFGRMFQMGDSGRHHGAQDTM